MAPRITGGTSKMGVNRGAWTPEEDRKLSQFIQLHGAKRWKTIATKAGSISLIRMIIFLTHIRSITNQFGLRLENERPQPSPPAKEALQSEALEPTTSKENEGTNGLDAPIIPPTPEINFNLNELFDFSMEGCHGLDWVNKFLELE
ncbi:hypothetical protein SAY87_024395 [Trapa incisa]|uniref:Uncharacterized protein n=1 Tax=Trapa incisa TaxID=236973 RepID=A0AAN7GKS4_9MYRT|nr:hypothetical protein SAY87_024395 [Trapa incisa]